VAAARLSCSALEQRGIEAVWLAILTSKPPSLTAAIWKLRQRQALEWLQKQAETEALHLLFARTDFDATSSKRYRRSKTTAFSPRTGLRQISEFSRIITLRKRIFMSYQYVNVEIIRKVAVIEFNYSRKLNALSKVFIDDLMQALSDLNRPEIRCVILRAPEGAKGFLRRP
jgi:hypothetical protein